MKTETILPVKKDTTLKKIVIVSPFTEYRYFNKRKLFVSIFDSSFACKYARIDSNYTLFPNRARFTKLFFSINILKELSKYSDSTAILNESEAREAKKELNSFFEIARTKQIKEYFVGDTLSRILKKIDGDRVVFSDVLVFQTGLAMPNLWIKFSLYVIDIRSGKIIFFKNSYIASVLYGKNPSKDLINDSDLKYALNGLVSPYKIPREYSKYLLKPPKKKREKIKREKVKFEE